MDDATLASYDSSDAAAMNRLILVLLLMMLAMMIVMMMVIHSLLRKEGSINNAVSRELLVVSQRLLDALLLHLLDDEEEGRVVVSSSTASDQQLMDNAAAVMKKKAAAAAKKKRNKRNKAVAKQKQKRGTKLIVWLGDGIIPRIMMVVVGSITTLIFALSLIHQSDGSGDVKAPPALRPSRITSLRQRDLQSSSSMPSTPPNNIMSPSPIPVGAQAPTPIFSPTAIERNALSDFYYSAGGPEWTDRSNWMDESTSYCDWKGVTCDEDMNHVIKLHLHNNGLSGRLSESIGNLTFIEELDLSDNDIEGSIPAELGKLSNLEYLRLSYNDLTGSIPENIWRSLPLKTLNLADNRLTGIIPSQLGQLQGASVFLKDNHFYNSSAIAPLSLCTLRSVKEFDLANDTALCPIERNALSDFYDSAKGPEWTDRSQWLHEYASYCDPYHWKGVTCDVNGHVIKLILSNNGLSGRLSESIGNLAYIEVLDLSDNDIEGSIPTEIGLLKYLTYLRLSYNAFTGPAPEFLELTNLLLLQLQSNRITEIPNIPRLNDDMYGPSTFVADCGVPSAFRYLLECEHCTMCCNANGDCSPQVFNIATQVAESESDPLTYGTIAAVCFACFFFVCFMIAISLYLFNKPLPEARLEEDDKNALSKICNDSVYSFFVTDNVYGWLVALVTLGIQVLVLYFFTMASDARSQLFQDFELLLTWKCPRDMDVCTNTANVGVFGWIVFCSLMIANLAKDVIGGCKLIYHSAKIGHSLTVFSRIRYFFGGVCLCSITLFAVYASAVYSRIISKNTAELIVNSVIILFVMELDEKVYSTLTAYNEKWTAHTEDGEMKELQEIVQSIQESQVQYIYKSRKFRGNRLRLNRARMLREIVQKIPESQAAAATTTTTSDTDSEYARG